jgi:hypothetical protein
MPWLSSIGGTIQRPRASCRQILAVCSLLLVSEAALAQQEAQERLLKPIASTLTTVPATTPLSGVRPRLYKSACWRGSLQR